MAYLFTLALIKVLLLTSWFALTGLVALWAATSSRHWFLRATIVWAAIAVWLAVPAYEALVVFACHIGLVVLGIAAYRMRQPKRAKTDVGPTFQFSLRSALLVSTLVAMFTFIAAQVPRTDWPYMVGRILGGAILASVTLVAAWLLYGRSTKPKRAGVAVAWLISFPIVFAVLGESNVYRFLGNDVLIVILLGAYDPTISFVVFYIALLLQFTVISLGLKLIEYVARSRHGEKGATKSWPGHTWHVLSRIALALLFALVVVPPALTIWDLSRPLESIDEILPDPNGRDVLVALGNRFPPPDFRSGLAGGKSYDAEFAELRRGLKLPFVNPVPLEPYSIASSRRSHETVDLNRICWALSEKAATFLVDGGINQSLECCFDMLELAKKMQQTGLLYDYRAASEFEYLASRGIYNTREHLNAGQCQSAVARLAEYDANRTDVELAISRNRNWEMRENAWAGRLNMRLLERAHVGDDYWMLRRMRTVIVPRQSAIVRLLIVELCLRQFQIDHAAPPQTLDELVPKYLAELPADPFSPENNSLQFKLKDGKYDLSSIGPAPLPNDSIENRYLFSQNDPPGEIRLEKFFSLRPPRNPRRR